MVDLINFHRYLHYKNIRLALLFFKNMGNMHYILANQIADIFAPNDNDEYHRKLEIIL